MDIANKTVLITGANRGIGRALVDEALRRGAKRVYAGTRAALQHADPRVKAVTLDVTSAAQIQKAAADIAELDVLVNNAGIAVADDLHSVDAVEQHLSVNVLGPFRVTNAFLPLLQRSHGAVVNILSVLALAPFPVVASYSLSKAAAHSLTQSLRAYLASQGVRVHGVYLGPVDTDMNRGFDLPKITPEAAARGIFDGFERGDDDIFPDPESQPLAEPWRTGALKALERQLASSVAASAAHTG
jgi:NAD(P)-dependent dehydrogenase (short-subunit alcohol dehydrogenase family)